MAPLQDGRFEQELGSTGLDVAFLGGPILGTAGSKSSELLNSRELSKSPDNCNLNHPPRFTGNEDSSINDCKKKKYSSMSAEVCPTRDRAVFQKKLAKKFDIRYVKEMKNIKQRIQSKCLLVSCGGATCDLMKERLSQHNRLHYPMNRKMDNGCGTHKAMHDRGIIVTPTLSNMRIPKLKLKCLNAEEGRCIQTDITMRDFSPTRLFTRNPTQKKFSDHYNNINNEIPLRKTETREIVPKKNFYREHLQNEVLHWLHHVPMFFSLNVTNKDIQNEVIHNLVNKINALAVEANEKNYEIKIKMEIEDCLNKLPMWLHGPKEDQILFKCSLREKLWNKIQELNTSFLGINYEKPEGLDAKLHESYEKEMAEWAQVLQLDTEETISRRQIVDSIMKKLSPLLKIPLHTTSYKLIMKGEIIEVLDNLSLTSVKSRYRTVQLNKLAEELANRLLSLQIKQGTASPRHARVEASVFHQVTSQVTGMPIPLNNFNYKKIIMKKIGEYLDRLSVCNRNDLKTEICSSFFDSKSCLRSGNQKAIREEICQFLRDTGKIPWDKAHTVAYVIVKQVNDVLKDIRKSTSTSFDYVMPHLSRALSVYRWGPENPAATSTPKKQKTKDVPKLSPEETTYIEKVAALVKIWMNKLPKQYNEEPGFQKTVIYDLAGDIMDHQKLQQLVPDSTSDKDKYQKYLIYKWLCKFDFYKEENLRTDSAPLVADFQKRLKDIEVPNLTASQHGTRQGMEHIKHMERGGGWEQDYVAKGIDVLEDQISVWLNEQPSEILSNKNKMKRNKMVHDLALNLQDHLRNKNAEMEIEEDINQWLTKMVNSKEKEHIGLLTQDLKDKVINLPQDRTLGVRHEERNRDIMAKIAAKRQLKAGELPTQNEEDVSNFGNIQGDPDKTIREFIAKYIEHYYDIDDPMATGAFAHLLKTELRKLAPPTRKEVYDNFEKLKTHQRFSPETLTMELEYIKIISDWLNNIPIDASYNTVRNKRRIEYINDLAKNILEIEEQRVEEPNVMDYNYLIASTILASMNTYDLPIPRKHRDNTPLMAHQLLEKVADLRPPEVYEAQTSTAGSGSLGSSIHMGDIKEQNLSDFINDYIRINGRDIAEDELKLEAWTARLMKEVKKMIHEGANPTTLTKAQVYEKFSGVPIPTQESIEAFGLKINYVKEISDWMKNLPILPIEDQPDYGEERIKMISELAEKMCDTEAMRRAHPSDTSADEELEEYIATWITRLPLDKSKKIILPILIHQLMSRMEKGSQTKPSSRAPLEKHRETSVDNFKSESSSSGSEKNKIIKKSVDKGDKRQSTCKGVCSKNVSKRESNVKFKSPADIIVEAIENWSKKLPIKLNDKNKEKSIKDGIARQLYQKIGELNVDPRIFNDELLYREMLEDEIETQLENVPQNSELQDNREEIVEELIDKIIETNQIIKENSTGDNYRHKLETTIDASIPNPVKSTQAFDPGFEIYKNHLADMFILENFDHANDDVKAKYEKRVRHEIDKYFECAQSKNALPLTKDQIYNEIYSALFKIPMPNENSVIDEVEQVKTRCEIDAWYEKLPIQQTDNINELLERDQILSTLAKRIQEIEKSGSIVDENINKEARKWLEKLPIKSGQGIDGHVKQLQSLLKSTASARKYVAPGKESKGKGKKVKEVRNKKGPRSPNTSQVPGPSGVLQSKSTNAKPCLQVCPVTHKKAGDILVEIVEEWCNKLPLISTEENNKAIRDNISTRIIIQISEFNMDADIFNDDVAYDELLDEELENVLSNLPVCCDFAKSKPARKHQLKEMIKAIKPLINEEKARHQYKIELNTTVANVLKEPHDISAEKLAIFNQLKEEIVENFVQYYYYINDEESRQFYKNQIHDCVVKFCAEAREKGTCEKVDPLVKRNQLLCELLKIPVPQSALREEVAEIKMKKEVEQFLEELSIPEGDDKTTLTKHLAKRLCDIEKSGYNPCNEKKMNSDITRCLTKLKKTVISGTVDDFVNKLKFNEAERKAPPITSSQAANLNQDGTLSSPKPFGTYETGGSPFQAQSPGMRRQTISQAPQSFKSADETWMSRKMANKMPASNYYTPVSMPPTAPQVWAWSPNEAQPYKSLTDSPIEYEDMRAGNLLNSSAAPQSFTPRAQSPGHRKSASGRPPINQNASLGYAQPSRRLSHQSLSASYPQNQRMREVISGPMLSRQSYGQIAIPRRGQSVSPRAPTSQGAASPRNITSDSFFEAPHFEPVPFPLTAVPVPIFDPFQLPGSGAARQGARRPSTRLDNALPCVPMQGAEQAIARDRRLDADNSDNDLCICKRCSRRTRRTIPYCLMAMDDDFDDCLGLPGLWYRMHLPDCFY